MVTRAGSSRLGLICSDCGTPVPLRIERGKPHPVVTGLTLVSLSTFTLLLFFLTNWRPLPAQQAASQRAMIKQLTTGAFVREPQLIENSAHSDE